MSKVVIDLSISLDGFIAGPDDGRDQPLGGKGGSNIFGWFQSGTETVRNEQLFRPAPGANREIVEGMYEEAGAFIFGRRTYDITNGWGGTHPVDGAPVFILTQNPPEPAQVPRGRSTLVFVTDGIGSAIAQARAASNGKNIMLQGASPGQQALAAGLCDEIMLHVAPYLLGEGIRLFDNLEGPITLEKLWAKDGPLATHIRYRVVKNVASV